SYRRIGLGSFLLKELYRRFKSMGIKGKIEVLCSPPEYWFPGISLKYTPALFWLKKNKFKRYKVPFMRFRQNLYVELDPKNNEFIRGYIEKKPPEENNGIIFRRAMVKDREELLEFVKKEFHNIWSLEADMSFKSINFDNEADNSTTFIAIDKISNRIVGFATYNAHFLGSFGPTGVLKSYRGRGIGGLLLKHALYEIKRSGVDRCIILWVVGNTVKYYSKVIGAYIGEVFYPMHGKIKI
ncbi:MAG: GNAT family N-acetyltransferase, partial [Promethearchaeota archaeon]